MVTPSAVPGRRSRTAVNLISYTLAQVGSALLALVIIGFLSRALGTEGFGAFSFSFVVASLGGLAVDFGLPSWLTRAAAQYAGRTALFLDEAIRFRAWSTVLGGGLTLAATALYLRDAGRLAHVAWMLAYVILLGYASLYEAVLVGKERADRAALGMGAGKLVELGAVLLWILLGAPRGVAGAAAALAVAAAIRVGLLQAMTRLVLRTLAEQPSRGGHSSGDEQRREARRRMLRETLPFAAGSAVWMTYFKVGVLILERLATPVGLGLYTAAYRVLEALLLLPRSVAGVLYPAVSSAWAQGSLTAALLSRPARALTALALACTAGLGVLAPDIMRLLFGESFAGGAGALRILGLAIVPLFLNYLLGVVFSGTHRQGRWVGFTLVAFAVNVTANLALIPRLGIEGAAWATLASESLLLVVLAASVARRLGRLLSFGWLLRAGLAAAAMGALVTQLPGPLAARVAAGAASYLLLAALLRVVSRDECRDLLEMVRGAAGRIPRPGQELGS